MKAFVFPTINLSATGMNIQRLRKSRGLSVKDLQEFFGFEAPQAIYKWQSGASLPSVDNLLALSQILEVPMERILVKNELPTPKEPDGSVFLFFLGSEDRSLPACSSVRAEKRTRSGVHRRVFPLPIDKKRFSVFAENLMFLNPVLIISVRARLCGIHRSEEYSRSSWGASACQA